MNCRSFQHRLQTLLDDRAAPEQDSELQEHAWNCECCQRLLTGQQRLWELLGNDNPPEVPANFATSVISRLEVPSAAAPQTSFNSALWIWMAVAACMLLMLTPLALQFGKQQPKPNQSVGQPQVSPQAPTINEFAQHDMLREPLDQVIDLWREVPVDEISVTLRPITASFSVTIDALRKTLPLPNKNEGQEPQAAERQIDVIA